MGHLCSDLSNLFSLILISFLKWAFGKCILSVYFVSVIVLIIGVRMINKIQTLTLKNSVW